MSCAVAEAKGGRAHGDGRALLVAKSSPLVRLAFMGTGEKTASRSATLTRLRRVGARRVPVRGRLATKGSVTVGSASRGSAISSGIRDLVARDVPQLAT